MAWPHPLGDKAGQLPPRHLPQRPHLLGCGAEAWVPTCIPRCVPMISSQPCSRPRGRRLCPTLQMMEWKLKEMTPRLVILPGRRQTLRGPKALIAQVECAHGGHFLLSSRA